MSDFTCPYCEEEIKGPDDAQEEGDDYEHECPKCEKSFVFSVSYSVSYRTFKADCLNGADHNFKRKTSRFNENIIRYKCEVCGEYMQEVKT